jgi:hypothetical protein
MTNIHTKIQTYDADTENFHSGLPGHETGYYQVSLCSSLRCSSTIKKIYFPNNLFVNSRTK